MFKTSYKSISGLLVTPKLQHLGTGVQAIAYYHKKTDKVIKTIQVFDKNDPSLDFIKICIENNNIFFPKIYSIKIYDLRLLSDEERESIFNLIDPTDSPPNIAKKVAVVTMEHLHPIHSEENRDISISLLQDLTLLPGDLESLPTTWYGSKDPLAFTNRKVRTISDRQYLVNSTLNEEFKQAMLLLEDLFTKHDPDLRKTNIMLRKTKEGPQLVFVDPIC